MYGMRMCAGYSAAFYRILPIGVPPFILTSLIEWKLNALQEARLQVTVTGESLSLPTEWQHRPAIGVEIELNGDTRGDLKSLIASVIPKVEPSSHSQRQEP